MAAHRKKQLHVKIVFDTNALFTDNEYHLLSKEVADLIRTNQHHLDVEIQWHLPEVVIMERRYRMEKRALELSPSIEKVERLIGLKLNVTGEILCKQVNEAIEKQIQEFKLQPIKLDHSSVGWERLVVDSAFRRPPFSPGTEKGFRDALVLESFLQLVEQSAASRAACRLVLVSGDELLRKAATDRVKEKNRENINILSTVEELKNLINTLVSQIDEATVSELRTLAGNLFWDFDRKKGFYESSGAMQKLQSVVAEICKTPPEGSGVARLKKYELAPPSFQKKEGGTITWSSKMDASLQAFKLELQSPPEPAPAGSPALPHNTLLGVLGLHPTTGIAGAASRGLLGGTLLTNVSTEVPTKTGAIVFDIIWTTRVTRQRKLKSPILVEVKQVETKWD